MADTNSELLVLSLNEFNRMKLEFVEIYESMINVAKASLQHFLMLKLRTMRACENQFNKHFSECALKTCMESDPFVKYDIKCMEMEDLNSSQMEVAPIEDELDYQSGDEFEEEFSSEFSDESDGSSNLDHIQQTINNISHLKNDKDIRRESKRMLEKLALMGAFVDPLASK